MHIASIGIDLGKTTFHLVALGERSKVLIRKKFSRAQLLTYTANLPSSRIGLEACAGAHFMGAALRERGHEVRLIPAQFVKPYRKSNKNDFLDAEAIAEAVTKQNMRFVPIKTEEQLDVQAMHRVRDRLVQRRTALINEICGFLLERGITFPAQSIHLRKNLPTVIEDAEQNLTPRLRWLLDRLWQEWKQTEIDIVTVTDEIERIAAEDERCRRLRQIPGFDPLVSTATVAAIGNGAAFRRGRDFAAWVGMLPRQYSTGGKQKLFGISKRGNIYLRRMLIHGARAVLFRVKYDTAGLGQWVHRLSQRAPRNKVIVAIANKLARIAWAVLSSGKDYRHHQARILGSIRLEKRTPVNGTFRPDPEERRLCDLLPQCCIEIRDYKYTIVNRDEIVHLGVETQRYRQPMIAWKVAGSPVTGNVVLSLEVLGGTFVDHHAKFAPQTVQVRCTLLNNELSLETVGTGCNFDIQVGCTVTDGSITGNVKTNVIAKPFVTVGFVGAELTVDPDYTRQKTACEKAAAKLFENAAKKLPQGKVKFGDPVQFGPAVLGEIPVYSRLQEYKSAKNAIALARMAYGMLPHESAKVITASLISDVPALQAALAVRAENQARQKPAHTGEQSQKLDNQRD